MLCLQRDYLALESDTSSSNIQFVFTTSFVYTFFSVLFCTALSILNKDFPLFFKELMLTYTMQWIKFDAFDINEIRKLF